MNATTIQTSQTETLKIRGREYRVEKHDNGYLLHGTRGACYCAMRNKPRPERLFLFDGRGGYSPVMHGVWLTDEGGELRVLVD